MSRQLTEPINGRVGRPISFERKHTAITKDYLKNHDKYGDKCPSVAGLACRLDKSKNTLYEWVKNEVDQEFTDAFNKLSTRQERSLLNNGLDGSFNSTITKLALVTNHGYSENNQADSSITVNVDRGRVSITSKDHAISVDTEKDITPIEHE